MHVQSFDLMALLTGSHILYEVMNYLRFLLTSGAFPGALDLHVISDMLVMVGTVEPRQ